MGTAGRVGALTEELQALRSFRQGLYACGIRRGDALFELCDTLCAGHGVATSPPPHLSLEPAFRRGWGSAYAALRRGRIAEESLRDLLAAARPRDWPAVYAVDASSWARCDAECSPDRGFYHHPSRHSNGKPIVAGWNYSWIAQLNWEHNSWTAPMDIRRIHPREDTGTVTADQVKALLGRLGDDGPVPLFVFDAGYDPIGLSVDLAEARAQVLVRLRSDRVFYSDPPEREPGAPGRPRLHGKRFACADPASRGEADATLVTSDPRYGRVEVQAWSGLHPKLAGRGRWAGERHPPIVTGTVIRVQVEHLPKAMNASGSVKTLWLWWSGPGSPDLDVCWRAYIHRFDIEHTLRFAKHTLGWTTPRIRLPEQADRWTFLVVAAYNQLRLARRSVADHRLPWEPPRDPARLTPTRVRRGFRQLVQVIGTPASPPKPSKAGPGRPKGSTRGPAPRHPAIKKAAA
ncbi:MAG: NF041680 family putative transposase [Acidimicrobiales bacterium]